VSAAGKRSPRKLRLFFALWPSDRHRAALAQATAATVAQVAGQPVPPGNLHLTLAFLGPVPGRLLTTLFGVGGQGSWPAVSFGFARIEYWAKPQVLVAMPAEVPAAGQAIVDRLWQGLEQLGFRREPRPWRPHLTLVRRVRRPPPENLELAPAIAAADPSAWRLALVESTTHPEGPRYRPFADWPLGGSRAEPPAAADCCP
jgi:2'-5' RNA ligase